MSTTPNLGITLLADSQAQKVATLNAGSNAFDAALTAYLATAMTDANYTLNVGATPSEATGYLAYKFTGALTADRNIVVPTVPKLFLVLNGTSGGHSLVVKTSAGTGIMVANGASALVYCDGTNVVTFAGIPSRLASTTVVDLTAQAAAKTTTTLLAVPSTGAGKYRISVYAKVTRAATSSSTLAGTNGLQLTWTDPTDSVAQTVAVPNQCGSTLTGNSTTTVFLGSVVVDAKASTNIQYAFDYTSSGATTMQYKLSIRIEFLG